MYLIMVSPRQKFSVKSFPSKNFFFFDKVITILALHNASDQL